MKLKLLMLILGLQSAWMLGTVFVQEHALHNGTVILLETRPVDPRDLLRGDYVVLSYRISRIPTNLFSPPLNENLTPGQTVWVALAPRGETHEVVRAATERFDAGPGEVLVKAKPSWWSPGTNPASVVEVEYGLERYYVGEGTGNPRGKLTVQAVVPGSGRASIKQVFMDGKPYAQAMKELAR